MIPYPAPGQTSWPDEAAPLLQGAHADWCHLAFGDSCCSCGSDINGFEGPLYEGGPLTYCPGPFFWRGRHYDW